MPYTVVKSFERGIDARKLLDTTEAGALLDARDCHVTDGGEIEKRAAFVNLMTLPAATVGLWVTEGRKIHTFGDTETPPVGLPAGVIYHWLPDPTASGATLVRIRSVEEFNSKLYVVAEFSDGKIWHFYDGGVIKAVMGDPVPDPGGGGDIDPPPVSDVNKPKVTVLFAPQNTTPEPQDVEITYAWLLSPTSTYNFTPGPTQDAFMLIAGTGTDASGRPIADPPIAIVNGTINGPGIAATWMSLVNPTVTTPKVYAQASGSSVKFFVDVVGTTYNGWKLQFGITRCQPHGASQQRVLSGGVNPDAPAVMSEPPPGPVLTDVLGDPMNLGTFAIAHNLRMWSVLGTLLNYSDVRVATVWNDVTLGDNQIDHSMYTRRAPHLVSLADYGGDLAVFGTRHIFVWFIDVTPLGDQKKQTIHGTGTFAAHSVVPWGQTDVMYLDTTGIRSLRARDSSEQAFSADIGALIDRLVREKLAVMTDVQREHSVWGIVDPRTGRLWMALHDKIFVLTFYPATRVAAWTWYDATTAPVEYLVSSDDSIYWRSGNDVMIYGGEDGDEYDDTEALVRVPYIDAGKNATHKNWTGIDIALLGTWQVRGSFDPMTPAASDLFANLTKSTYAQQKIAINGESPTLSLELRSTYIGPARIGNATMHYTDSTAD